MRPSSRESAGGVQPTFQKLNALALGVIAGGLPFLYKSSKLDHGANMAKRKIPISADVKEDRGKKIPPHAHVNGKLAKPSLEPNLRLSDIIGEISVISSDGIPKDEAEMAAFNNTLGVSVEIASVFANQQNARLAFETKKRSGENTSVCTKCEEPISAARIKAVPYAIRCTTCQEAYERDLTDEDIN